MEQRWDNLHRAVEKLYNEGLLTETEFDVIAQTAAMAETRYDTHLESVSRDSGVCALEEQDYGIG